MVTWDNKASCNLGKCKQSLEEIHMHIDHISTINIQYIRYVNDKYVFISLFMNISAIITICISGIQVIYHIALRFA